MVGSVSNFGRMMQYQLGVRNNVKRQMAQSLYELGHEVDIPDSVDVSVASRKGPSGGGGSNPSQRVQSSSSSRSVERSASVNSGRAANPKRRRANIEPGGRKMESNRNRKAIANTQADKRGRDSGSLTTLETSGIDGKGLKINQVR